MLNDSFFMHPVVSIKHIRLENLFQHEGQVLYLQMLFVKRSN